MEIHSVSIRPAAGQDTSALWRIEEAAMSGLVPSTRVISEAEGRYDLLDHKMLFDNKQYFTYLAEDAEPFGFVTGGRPEQLDLLPDKTGEIVGIYVMPDYWGKGIGRKLLIHSISVLRRRHFETAALWVQIEAVRLMKVVESAGFSANGLSRIVNSPRGSASQQCFQLDISDFF